MKLRLPKFFPRETLIMALDQSDVRTLDPGREFEFGAAFVDLNVYDTLVAHKSPKELNTYLPILATEWKVSPDGKEYTFKLRPNVKFASGNPFTAEDVKFSLTRLKNLKGNPGWMMDPLKEVVVIDPMTVKTVLNESFADWFPVLSGPNAAILDSKLAKEHGVGDRVELYCGNLDSLPFPESQFEFVLSCAVLLHVPKNEAKTILAELRRVLAKNGRLVLAGSFPNVFNPECALTIGIAAP